MLGILLVLGPGRLADKITHDVVNLGALRQVMLGLAGSGVGSGSAIPHTASEVDSNWASDGGGILLEDKFGSLRLFDEAFGLESVQGQAFVVAVEYVVYFDLPAVLAPGLPFSIPWRANRPG